MKSKPSGFPGTRVNPWLDLVWSLVAHGLSSGGLWNLYRASFRRGCGALNMKQSQTFTIPDPPTLWCSATELIPSFAVKFALSLSHRSFPLPPPFMRSRQRKFNRGVLGHVWRHVLPCEGRTNGRQVSYFEACARAGVYQRNPFNFPAVRGVGPLEMCGDEPTCS